MLFSQTQKCRAQRAGRRHLSAILAARHLFCCAIFRLQGVFKNFDRFRINSALREIGLRHGGIDFIPIGGEKIQLQNGFENFQRLFIAAAGH